MSTPSDQSYYTFEMEQAERELDARIDYALDQAREVQAQTEELEAKNAAKDEPPSDADVERIEKFVRGHAHTEEWRKVLERIDRGHLTWRQVVDGLAGIGPEDREVTQAFNSLSRVPPASLEELIEIGVFPAELPGDETAADTEPKDQAPQGKKRRFDHPDEDEWFEDSSPLGRD
jgi:hypothetical protein